ncbi:unnamed protein product [Effrenium voratum]|uniref:G-patch domain-containing protein n=1 Tax=Effrenium voratum TaxID=2562239 RepID=A0AA36J847_9DINO|nr:unnamed protein product [Effrenium voratum]
MALKLLAALGIWASPNECLTAATAPTRPQARQILPPGATQAKAQMELGREVWLARLPVFHTWPVFWTARTEVVPASAVHWPDETWAQLSPAVRDILEGSLAGERRQALHADLLPLTSGPAGPGVALDIEGATEKEVRAARTCLQFAKRQLPQSAIGVQDAIARKMQQWYMESVKSGVVPATAQQVVTLSQWAMETNNCSVITHVLAGDAKPKLLPIAEVHRHSEALASVEKLSQVKLPYVSMLYTASSPQDAPKWEAFWQRCGLRSSFSFVANVLELQSSDHAWLPNRQVPARRTSKKEGELPYGLGKLPHTALRVVDVMFSQDWSQVIARISQAQPPEDQEQEEQWRQDARAFARLVSKMHVDIDSTAATTMSEVPAAEPPKLSGGSKSLSEKSPPSHRCVYFMPPGQPGEKRLPLYPAHWLRLLNASRWVPAKEVGGASKRGWFKPCEVLLKADPARPGLPVADLPADLSRSLEALKNLFAWGTVAPEPPVERLAQVGAAALRQAGCEPPGPLWRAVANAQRLGTLTPAQRGTLKRLGRLPVFPAPAGLLDGADRLTADRLVVLQAGGSQEELEEVKALVDAKWLVDVRSDWPLRDVVEDVLPLVEVPTRPSKACMKALVCWCCSAEPETLSEELRTALTHALASIAAEAKKKGLPPPQAMKQLMPQLKLFCKEGPGLGKGRFPSRWLSAYAPGPGGVLPVLNDDATKAAMLTPAQGLQLLGFLDHPQSRFPSAARLQAKDRQVTEALGIMRLSDPAIKLQTRITGEAMVVPGSADRISIVLKLLWRSAGKELPADHVKVRLRKCAAIARELSLGNEEGKATCMEAFAMWGEADPEDTSSCDLLVAGDVDDYAAEVEELFEARYDTIFRAFETRPAKVLRLLRHLEIDKDFDKFLGRDFAGVLEQQELEKRKAEAKARLNEAAEAQRVARATQLQEQLAAKQATQLQVFEQQRLEERRRLADQKAEAEAFLEATKAAKAQADAEALKAAQAKAKPVPAPTGPTAPAAPVPAEPPGLKPVIPPRILPVGSLSRACLQEATGPTPTAAVPAVEKRSGIYPLPNMVKVGSVPPAGDQAGNKSAEEEPKIEAEGERAAKRQRLAEDEAEGRAAGDGGVQKMEENANGSSSSSLSTLQQELDKLRRENEALRTRAGHTATMFPVLGHGGEKEEEDQKEQDTVVTKGQIKRMKLEAKEVLYRPISEGFGYKMLQKFGWKEGEGLGKQEKGLATPLWVDPREGRSGLFSAQSGESRPPKPPEAEEDWFNPKPLSANPLRFVGEGEASGPRGEKSPEGELGGPGRIGPLGVLGFVPAQSAGAPQMVRAGMMPRPRSSVAPALIGLLSDQRWAGGGGATMLGELLAEALDSAAAERFLRLAEERLGSWGRIGMQIGFTSRGSPRTHE